MFYKCLALLSVKKAYSKNAKQFGKRVKELRTKLKMTQQALSDESDIDIRTVQRIEVGEISPSLDIISAIAKGFQMSLTDLFKY